MDGGVQWGGGGVEGPKRHLKAQTGLQACFKSRYSSFTTSQPEITIWGPAFVFVFFCLVSKSVPLPISQADSHQRSYENTPAAPRMRLTLVRFHHIGKFDGATRGRILKAVQTEKLSWDAFVSEHLPCGWQHVLHRARRGSVEAEDNNASSIFLWLHTL